MNLTIRLTLVLAALAWPFAAASVAQTSGAAEAPPARREPFTRPNVLLISVDDLNHSLGAYGNRLVKTPNIDRLARRGLRFDRAYSQYPLCNPSRASFLSGLRPETTGIFDLRTAPRERLPGAVFLPQLYRQHGYFTARVGKVFHDGREDALSWDVSEEGTTRAPQEAAAVRARYQRPPNQRSPEWIVLDAADDTTGDGIIARRIVQLMQGATQAGKQFFLAAGFRKPHLPWTAPKKYFELYPAAGLQPAPAPALHDIPPIALMTELHASPPPASAAQAVAAYYACVSFTDAQIGVLLDELDRTELWDSTIVVLLSDHGFHLGDHGGLWAKLTLFEQSARAPLIIAAPGYGRSAGRATARTVELLDVYPTLAELSGLRPPADLEGLSLVPLLKNPRAARSRPAYTLVHHGKILGRSVRTERWRYTEWDQGSQGTELYDHAADAGEHRNLAGDRRYARKVRELKRLLDAPKR